MDAESKLARYERWKSSDAEGRARIEAALGEDAEAKIALSAMLEAGKEDPEAAARILAERGRFLSPGQAAKLADFAAFRERVKESFVAFHRANGESLGAALSEPDEGVRRAMIESWGERMADEARRGLGG